MTPRSVSCLVALCLTALFTGSAHAALPRYTVYGSLLTPQDRAARDYSRPGYGLGIDLSWPVHGTEGMLSAIVGIEGNNLMAQQVNLQDRLTGLRVEQHTDQSYGRLFVGSELGPHGNGTVQPYGNLALAIIMYGISTSVVVPDDFDREKDINQVLRSRTEFAFGWSAGTGVNLNFGGWGLDGGVRFMKQYGVPQQLGDGAVTVQPAYVQYRLGVSIPMRRR